MHTINYHSVLKSYGMLKLQKSKRYLNLFQRWQYGISKSKIYKFRKLRRILACDSDKLIEIAWHWYVPLLAISVFYSDTKENPEFIYCSRGGNVWFADDYDNTQETFYISGTEHSIKFSEAFDKEKSIEYDENEK